GRRRCGEKSGEAALCWRPVPDPAKSVSSDHRAKNKKGLQLGLPAGGPLARRRRGVGPPNQRSPSTTTPSHIAPPGRVSFFQEAVCVVSKCRSNRVQDK